MIKQNPLLTVKNQIVLRLKFSDGRPSSPLLPTAPLACHQPVCQLVANSPPAQCFATQPDSEHSSGHCHACESCMDAKNLKSKTKKEKKEDKEEKGEMKEHQVEELSCLSCSSSSCHLPCVLALLNSHQTPLYNTGYNL